MNKCCANRISGEILYYWQVFREPRAAATAATTTKHFTSSGFTIGRCGCVKEFGPAAEKQTVLREPPGLPHLKIKLWFCNLLEAMEGGEGVGGEKEK